ncbi:MAG: hypothetical protein Q9218_000550 [Villophora microphyllina]
MTVTIYSLPYELLSSILEEAAFLNSEDIQQYTYGVESTSAPQKAQRILRGHVAPDALRWLSTDAIRCVDTKWHDWACQWTQSRELHSVNQHPSKDVVYRDPYLLLRKTVDLFAKHPSLASSVRRIFFDGYYGIETNAMIFRILKHCDKLDTVSLPWTTLRYGSAEDWSHLLRARNNGTVLLSLELLAVDLKQIQLIDRARQVNSRPLESANVSFGHLERLKLSGSSNLLPIQDDDLITISRTAQLREIHVTGTTAITTKGLMAVCRASRETLRVLEHSPLSDDGFEHPHASPTNGHACEKVVQCSCLNNLAVSLPTFCGDLFLKTSVHWAGEVQIRAAAICGQAGTLRQNPDSQRALFDVLGQARSLVQAQQGKGIELNIEIFIGITFANCLLLPF